MPCPHGSITTAYNAASCDACIIGQYANSPATACTDCAGGQYHATTGAACTACEVGKFAEAPAATACVHCPSGKYQDGNSPATVCTDCVSGKWTEGKSLGNSLCVLIPTSYPTPYPTAAPTPAPTPIDRGTTGGPFEGKAWISEMVAWTSITTTSYGEPDSTVSTATTAVSFEACQTLCDFAATCIAWTFNKGNDKCLLHTTRCTPIGLDALCGMVWMASGVTDNYVTGQKPCALFTTENVFTSDQGCPSSSRCEWSNGKCIERVVDGFSVGPGWCLDYEWSTHEVGLTRWGFGSTAGISRDGCATACANTAACKGFMFQERSPSLHSSGTDGSCMTKSIECTVPQSYCWPNSPGGPCWSEAGCSIAIDTLQAWQISTFPGVAGRSCWTGFNKN